MNVPFDKTKLKQLDEYGDIIGKTKPPKPRKALPLDVCVPIPLRDLDMNVGPRQWVYGTSLITGMLSILGGVGGVGKTSYAIKVMLSIVIGRPLLALERDDPAHVVHKTGNVWYYSLEDPMDELIRRVSAELIDCNLMPRQVWDKVFLQSGRDAPLIVARGEDGKVIREDVTPIVEYLTANNIKVAAIDPFANCFEGADAENQSGVMKVILDQWRIIAHRANCAVWLIHHFRKGGLSGDADAFRGSSTIQNAARIMETLTVMTEKQAEKLGIPYKERRHYVLRENAKMNLVASPEEGEWYRFDGVPLGNRTDEYPKGDVIGVLRRWQPREVVMTWQQAESILNIIEQGDPDGMYYTSAVQGDYSAVSVISGVTGFTTEQAKAVVKEWLGMGLLTKGTYRSPKNRHMKERLLVDRYLRDALVRDLEERE